MKFTVGQRVFTEYRDDGHLRRRFGNVIEVLPGLVVVSFDCSLWKHTPMRAEWLHPAGEHEKEIG